jgi:signal transduction histidine kinase
VTHDPPAPWWQRLSTRLTLLLLGVVGALVVATSILLWRALQALLGADASGAPLLPGADPEAVSAVLRSTLINLLAVVAATVIAAVAFARALLAGPIEQLTHATRSLAAGEQVAALPVRDRSELGELAEAFNRMASALRTSQERLEARVAARTAELQGLLDLSNTIATTSELAPLLQAVLDRVEGLAGVMAADIWERSADDGWLALASHNPAALPVWNPAVTTPAADLGTLVLPLRVGERPVGVLRARAAADAPWDEERRRLLLGLAAQAAVAIENVRLYERARDEASDAARRHLARELHDSVSQAIYAIVLTAHAAQQRAEQDPRALREALDPVVELAEGALVEMRALIFELRPEALADIGLIGALERQLQGLVRRHGLAAKSDLGSEPPLPLATKQVLLRVAQEGLHNVVKHARARGVEVELGADGGHLRLRIRDDGVGFDPSASHPGRLGLMSMRERLAALGGRLLLVSAPGAGTTLTAEVPCEAEETP